MSILKPGLYRHYKGMNYKVHYIVKHSESLEDMVLYETLYENELGKMWVRPLGMFLEKVDVNGVMVDRFEFISSDLSSV